MWKKRVQNDWRYVLVVTRKAEIWRCISRLQL